MSLIAGIQNNYLLKNLPTSIALNIINNCKRYIKTRGSEIYREGEAFDGRLNLLLAGEVQICKRYQIIATENCELIENRETTHLFAPRVDFTVRPIGGRKSGDFIERDLIQLNGRRNHSAYVASEAALVLSIDVNLLLAVDKTFGIINNISEVVVYQQVSRQEADQRIKKMDLMVNQQDIGSTETAIRAKLSFDPKKEDSFVRNHAYGFQSSEKPGKLGFNTLISRVSRTRDRHLIANRQQNRVELSRVSNSPALNKTIQEEPDAPKTVNRSFNIQKTTQQHPSRNPSKDREKERIHKVVLDNMDREDPLMGLIEGEGNPICRLIS